ncbi:MAG: hypothetical protein COU22_02675 [Candidatus Komeilibacteria bacterium CG10_big_fil_rev_8_21_14_0_10_41_13]|uniref:DUF7847 domain-containing protein n=1 Tax=Candidatus Komeilibacteria bacterium CG10_big_fil_rev_8_21_14_0_10_41_13 TaxID=1974476 RepID=A0A2M6WC20_9BACT|nr:MAG: hypothetical protein COU22_02675 [Candidatus Komeilibacteria bacterium CG10_big_fil_rev_8_21_14_0_10_41_13]
MTSIYRVILKKAWLITKKFRYLWPLGLFAAFLGNGGEYQILFNQSRNVAEQSSILEAWAQTLKIILPQSQLSGADILPLILNYLFVIIIIALFAWLAISSFGGLIAGAKAADDSGEKSSFGALFKQGSKKFWPLLGVNIVAKAIIYGVIGLIMTPLMLATFSQSNPVTNLIVILITFVIFIPLSIIVSLSTKYASAYIVLNGEKCWNGFKKGWQLFFNNWLVSLEMALLIFAINLLVSLAFVLLSLLIFSPFFFFGIVYTIESPTIFNSLIYTAVFLLLLISAVFGSLLATFQVSSWTLLFSKLTGGDKAYSKIMRVVAGFPSQLKKKI